MTCPNCGRVSCYCTWDDIAEACEILRRRERAARRAVGKPSMIEEEEERKRKAEREVKRG